MISRGKKIRWRGEVKNQFHEKVIIKSGSHYSIESKKWFQVWRQGGKNIYVSVISFGCLWNAKIFSSCTINQECAQINDVIRQNFLRSNFSNRFLAGWMPLKRPSTRLVIFFRMMRKCVKFSVNFAFGCFAIRCAGDSYFAIFKFLSFCWKPFTKYIFISFYSTHCLAIENLV